MIVDKEQSSAMVSFVRRLLKTIVDLNMEIISYDPYTPKIYRHMKHMRKNLLMRSEQSIESTEYFPCLTLRQFIPSSLMRFLFAPAASMITWTRFSAPANIVVQSHLRNLALHSL